MAVSAATHCALCIPEVLHPEGDARESTIIFLDMDGVMKWGATALADVKKIFPDVIDLGKGYKTFVEKRSLLAGRGIDPWEKIGPNANETLWSNNYFDYCFTVVKGRQLNKNSLDNLQQLIERVEATGKRALVVISSPWRSDATTKELREEVFNETPFGKHICGKAAPTSSEARWTPECKYGGIDFTRHAKKTHGIDLNSEAKTIEYWLKDHGLEEASFVILDDNPLELTSSEGNRFGNRFVRVTGEFTQAIVDEAFAQLCLKNKDLELSGKGE